MNKSEKNIVYFDYSMIKKITPQGELKTYKNNEALSQSIKIWIATEWKEKIRTRGGGVLTPFLGKTLDESTAKEMEKVLRYNLEEVFEPNITVVELKVEPNTIKERWEIYIVGYNIELSLGINDYVYISNK